MSQYLLTRRTRVSFDSDPLEPKKNLFILLGDISDKILDNSIEGVVDVLKKEL